MKITLEHYDQKVTIEMSSDSTNTDAVADIMYRVCVAAGFNAKNVADSFADIAESYHATNSDSEQEIHLEHSKSFV